MFTSIFGSFPNTRTHHVYFLAVRVKYLYDVVCYYTIGKTTRQKINFPILEILDPSINT